MVAVTGSEEFPGEQRSPKEGPEQGPGQVSDAHLTSHTASETDLSDTPTLDPQTVESLYDQHSEELRRFLFGVLGDAALAADVLHIVFVKLLEVGHTTQKESRKAWLFRVAWNEALAWKRRGSAGRRAIERSADEHREHEQPAEAPLVRHESIERVRSALQRLPPDQAQVVRMRIYEDKTFATIAQELNIPLGTALGRMRTALAKLRKALEEADE